ncbi:MerR family transcriptional regulator, partial [Micrococcus luteus]|nr:MerR family transcriptional regulator [Micrococcus luteus]
MLVEWTVQELADRAGVSGRTLRHYHQIGLLTPDRIGANGYRYYGPTAVARLQRILLLRETGLSLAAISEALASGANPDDEINALEGHLAHLEHEREVLGLRIASVEHTLAMRREGRQPRMDMMLEGFNDRYEAEVTEQWGRDVFEQSNRWWHAK